MAALVWITVPTVIYGGASLLRFIIGEAELLRDAHVAQMFRAGHAHAGVLILLALVGLLYTPYSGWSPRVQCVLRMGLVLGTILVPFGMFASIIPSAGGWPHPLIALSFVGGVLLAITILAVGIGLWRGPRA
jgi:hypothetical protein